MIRRFVVAWALLPWLALPAMIAAASPSPSPAGGDTRSPGEGPGLVGEPLLALGLVLGIALVAVALTVAYVRFTPPPAGPGPSR